MSSEFIILGVYLLVILFFIVLGISTPSSRLEIMKVSAPPP